jgi:hypothetical protein
MASNKKMTIGKITNCHILKMKQQAISATFQDAMPASDKRNNKMQIHQYSSLRS